MACCRPPVGVRLVSSSSASAATAICFASPRTEGSPRARSGVTNRVREGCFPGSCRTAVTTSISHPNRDRWATCTSEASTSPVERGKVVAQVGSNAMYAAGHLLYVIGNSLMAQAVRPRTPDGRRGDSHRRPDPELLHRLNYGATVGGFTVSTTGWLLHHAGARRTSTLRWMNRDGTPGATLSDGFTLVGGVEFSPNRLQLAVSDNPENGAGSDVWMVRLDPGTEFGTKIQFTSDPASDQNPIFTPKRQDDDLELHTERWERSVPQAR